MRVGKPPQEVERVDPEQGKIRIGRDPMQERAIGQNPLTPIDIEQAAEIMNRLRVGRTSGRGSFVGKPGSDPGFSTGDGSGQGGSGGGTAMGG